MSWFAKVCFFFLSISTLTFAERIKLSDTVVKTTFRANVVASNAVVKPVEISLSIPEISVSKTEDDFDEVIVDGLVPLEKIGSPQLVTTGSLIAVPDGYEARVSILHQKEVELQKVVVRPAQRTYRCAVTSNSFEFNSKLYGSAEIFPANVVELEEVGRLQDLKLQRVALYPLRMDMRAKTLKVAQEIVLRVDFIKIGNTRQIHLPKTFFQLSRLATVNGQALGNAVRRAAAPETMLIFTAASLKDGLKPLLEWKTSKGISTAVFTLEEAGGTKEKLKSFIKNYYDTHDPKPSYLVLVGNGTTMPTFMEPTGSGKAASDYPFSLLSGEDIVPDILYGRIVADNLDELARQITRWIDYEKAPQSAASWYTAATTIASNEGSGPSDAEYAKTIENSLRGYTYKNVDQFYQGTSTATATNISNALKDGRSWLSYFGHGTGTAWGSTNDTFDVARVGQLQNPTRLPVIIDVACSNASFVTIPKCFGKAWVTHQYQGQNAGAVAFLGGSVFISWHPPAIMSVGIAKYHFEKPVYTLGGSVLAGQTYLMEKKGTGADVVDNLKWYHLLGDPSLLIRTSTPLAYQVKHSLTKQSQNSILNVVANDLSGKAVPGLLVALANPSTTGAPIAVGRTDANGSAVLEVADQLEPNTLMTVTGYNAETYQELIN
ncbi:MAG: hypothetical protein HY537_07480 [Deltaproteobacteria bacterium]|nr:hypothetical protein [Deltaproteobacteria bacterium]